MKKILLFMLPIMALSLASCEKNKEEEEWIDDSPIIQFNDLYFLQAALEGSLGEYGNQIEVDKNRDRQISEKEASVVGGLSVGFADILNMDEIKYFTALTFLECVENKLTSLDLSNNTALTDLHCSDNKLTSLDLSNNTALTRLECNDNPLTKIILPKNHNVHEDCIQSILNEYGDIIEYKE
mgnify:CR=1 FL=1